MHSDGAHHVYREELSKADPPCIPYLGVYLTDLTFIEVGSLRASTCSSHSASHPWLQDGNPDYVDNVLINFSKRRLVYDVIAKVQQYQQLPYNFHPIPQIQEFLLAFPHKDEGELWQISLNLEPRKADRTAIA